MSENRFAENSTLLMFERHRVYEKKQFANLSLAFVNLLNIEIWKTMNKPFCYYNFSKMLEKEQINEIEK